MRNSIVANSNGADCNLLNGTFNATYSLVEDGSCGVVNGVNNNLTGDPNLGPLQNNGGATFTHALLSGSPAINAGSNILAVDSNNLPLLTDQRGAGFSRIFNAIVDIGAFESAAEPSALVEISGKILSPTGKGVRNAVVYMTDKSGAIRSVRSTSFGYYRFTDVRGGETYVINVASKTYQYEPLIVTVTGGLTELNFIPRVSQDEEFSEGKYEPR